MAQATHTPGPWHICEVTGRGLKLIRDKKGYCVAEAVQPANSGAMYIDAMPNARLIAAAPELLAALEAALPHIQFAEQLSRGSQGRDVREALRQARAAIAKAKGE